MEREFVDSVDLEGFDRDQGEHLALLGAYRQWPPELQARQAQGVAEIGCTGVDRRPGGHHDGRSGAMTTPTAQDMVCPALPAGTDTTCVGNWEAPLDGNIPTRLCWSDPIPLPDHLSSYDVRAVVQQLPDCTTTDPEVHIGAYRYSVSDARLIARALLDAANVGERMAAR